MTLYICSVVVGRSSPYPLSVLRYTQWLQLLHKQVSLLGAYSDLPNNRAANLIIFWENFTYTPLLRATCLLILGIFPSKPDFHLHK